MCDCHLNTLPCPYAFMERHGPGFGRDCAGVPPVQSRRAAPGRRVSAPTERFSSRAGHYARSRPSYPHAAIELLRRRCGLGAAASVADLGSGTGILSELLLESGAQVYAVEPNDAMRAVAEAQLGTQAGFHSVKATAEATSLPADSIDLLVAGQAFHWFDVEPARREALRVVRAGGWGALLWNERPEQPTGFLAEYEALLLRHASEYARIAASRADLASMRRFFGGNMEFAAFPNEQTLDFDGLVGRLCSSSYAPEPGHPQYEPMMAGLSQVFHRHARDGAVVFPYRTLVYFGELKPPAGAAR
jgi:SAM-dependent methyltransferase